MMTTSQLASTALREALHNVAKLVPGPALAIESLNLSGSTKLESAFAVDTAALAAAALPNLAAGITALDRDRVATTFSCHVEVDGKPVPKWADLSGMYQTSNGGFIQFHCNFDHHRDGIVAILECEATRESVQEAVLGWDEDQLESTLIEANLIAARVRTLDEWNQHPHALATAHLPLISVQQIGEAAPRQAARRTRVLDCSRVLAGPVAGMTLAAHGADVLRIGAPDLPSVDICVMGTGFGKRNAYADLKTHAGQDAFGKLLSTTDVWIDAFRPGAFEGHGFGIEQCAPGSVTVQLSAFDWVGPWAGRRGFDSIVQSTTGIGDEGMRQSGADVPTPLPVQALDYCTGLLASFAAQQLVAHQSEHGGTWLARLSLLRTRNWLTGLGAPKSFTPQVAAARAETLHIVQSPFGRITAALPLGGSWDTPPTHLGSSQPEWSR